MIVHLRRAYQLREGASPAKRYKIAVAMLEAGLPTPARKLLDQVVAEMPGSAEVWFHWLLAQLGGRTLADLSPAERDRLALGLARTDRLAAGRWTAGIDMIRRLMRPVLTPDVLAVRLEALEPEIGAKIRRHLERLLGGALKDELWEDDVARARAARHDGGRASRVRKFFEPDPAEPCAREVRPATFAAGQRTVTAVASAVFAGASGWLAAGAVRPAVLSLVAGGIAVVHAVQWRAARPPAPTPPEPGHGERPARASEAGPGERAAEAATASEAGLDERAAAAGDGEEPRPVRAAEEIAELDRFYDEYAARLAPSRAWLDETRAARRRLRDDVAAMRGGLDETRWLIRYQVRELLHHWLLHGVPRERPHPLVKAVAAAGTAVGAAAGCWAAQVDWHAYGPGAAGALLLVVCSGWAALVNGLPIAVARVRVAGERQRRERRLTAYWFEFQRRRQWLNDRPDDAEMARWLDCDRLIMIDRALRAHRLRWCDVRAYATLEAPGPGSRKARWLNGPWRCSGYRLIVFLLTDDGVRQVTADLDMASASFHGWQRAWYPYDAVTAVRVDWHDDGRRDFGLSVAGGDGIAVAAVEPGRAGVGESRRILADGALDASGLAQALSVLRPYNDSR